MLAPLPAIVQVLDATRSATDHPRTTNVPARPASRQVRLCSDQACGGGQHAYEYDRGQSSAPNLSFLQNASPGKLSRAARTWRASRQCWPKRTCTPSKLPQLLFVSSQADSAGKSAATAHLREKVQHLPSFIQSSSDWKPTSTGHDTSNNYTNRPWAQEIITAA